MTSLMRQWMTRHKEQDNHDPLKNMADQNKNQSLSSGLSYAVIIKCHQCIDVLLESGASRQEAIQELQQCQKDYGEFYERLWCLGTSIINTKH